MIRPRRFMLLKMTKYGLKSMLLCSKNSEIWSSNRELCSFNQLIRLIIIKPTDHDQTPEVYALKNDKIWP